MTIVAGDDGLFLIQGVYKPDNVGSQLEDVIRLNGLRRIRSSEAP